MPTSDDTSKSLIPSNPKQSHTFKFQNEEFQVYSDEDGEPQFVASHVCHILEIANVSNVLARLDDDEKDNIRDSDVMGRMREIAVVTEAGLYSIIFRSNKPIAKEFKRWVAHEVLPSIRKTGSYQIQNMSPLQQLKAMVSVLEEHEAQLDNHAERITSLEAHVQSEPEYYTVLGYFIKRGLHTPTRNDAIRIGQKASQLSRVKGYGIGKANDPRYGTVNTYHIEILDEIVG